METKAIDEWLGGYRAAWQTDAPGDIASLFTEGVRYYTAPYRDPLVGTEEVVAYWVGEAEAGIPWTFEYEVVAREGDRYVVRAVTRYPQGESSADSPLPREFHNLWLVTLTDDGRASEFVEFFMLAE
jgi:hypothetical protein